MKSDKEKILEQTQNGLTVFVHYLGESCQKKMFKNPFRQDTKPSCHLYNSKGIYVVHDFGDSGFHGDCFWLVGWLNNLDTRNNFPEILKIIDNELNLGVLRDSDTSKQESPRQTVKITPEAKETPKYANFMLKCKRYSTDDLAYWGRYGITEEVLKRYDVRNIMMLQSVNSEGKSFQIASTYRYPMYAYCFDDGKGVKIYRPQSKLRFLQYGDIPRPYIFGNKNLPDIGLYVFITGGEKDVMSLAAHGFSAICFNSETAKIPEDVLTELSLRFMYIVLLYDSDETGQRESLIRQEEARDKFKLYRLVLPLPGTKKSKDISDYFLLGHTAEEFSSLVKKCINDQK